MWEWLEDMAPSREEILARVATSGNPALSPFAGLVGQYDRFRVDKPEVVDAPVVEVADAMGTSPPTRGVGSLVGALIPDSWEDKFKGFLGGLAGGFADQAAVPVDYLGQLGPVPNPTVRSLDQIMRDPGLRQVANQQIIGANAAIGRENSDLRKQMQRNVESQRSAGAHQAQQVRQTATDHAGAQKAVQAAQNTDQARQQSVVDDVLKNVALNMIADDNARGQLQASQAENRQERQDADAASDALIAGIGASGQDALAQMEAAVPMQTEADVRATRNQVLDQVATNRTKAADNWLGRSGILAELAAREQGAEQQRAALAMERFKAAAGIAESRSTIDMQRAAAEAEIEAARAKASGSTGMAAPTYADMVAAWKLWNVPSGPAQKYADEENREQTWQPQRRDTATEEELRAAAEMFTPWGLPAITRQIPPNIETR